MTVANVPMKGTTTNDLLRTGLTFTANVISSVCLGGSDLSSGGNRGNAMVLHSYIRGITESSRGIQEKPGLSGTAPGFRRYEYL